MQRTLKRESKVLEIAERKTIATDRCGLRHDPSLVGFRKKPKNGGRIVFFFPFFIFFSSLFLFSFPKAGDVSTGGGWASIGSGDGRRPPSKWVHRVAREAGQSVREGGGEIFFFFFFPSRADRLSGDRFGRLRSRNLRRPQAIVRWTEVKKISQDDVRP